MTAYFPSRHRRRNDSGGDPTGTGAHNCGTKLPDEFLPGLRFDRAGRLAIATAGRRNSGGCQFFITVAR